MPRHSAAAAALVFTVLLAAAYRPAAQIPEKPQNLQHLRRDITREELVQRMREFSFALGVRCQYCHAGGDGISFQDVDFASDDKPAKQKARYMLRLVNELNDRLLPGVPARTEPPVRIDCATCHRGSPLPRTLDQELELVIAKEGAEAAAAKYRALRRDTMHLGRYNFGEWTVNELADRLMRQKTRTPQL
jgi:hypothetical protein